MEHCGRVLRYPLALAHHQRANRMPTATKVQRPCQEKMTLKACRIKAANMAASRACQNLCRSRRTVLTRTLRGRTSTSSPGEIKLTDGRADVARSIGAILDQCFRCAASKWFCSPGLPARLFMGILSTSGPASISARQFHYQTRRPRPVSLLHRSVFAKLIFMFIAVLTKVRDEEPDIYPGVVQKPWRSIWRSCRKLAAVESLHETGASASIRSA